VQREIPVIQASGDFIEVEKLKHPKCVKALITVSAVAVILSAITVRFAEAYALVADADLPIRRVANQADSPTNIVGTLTAGSSVVVLGCEDYKSDIALQVRMETGEVGYVSDGAFHLKREDLVKHLLSNPKRLVWTCRAFFDNRKVD
jgi:hypothetical protein